MQECASLADRLIQGQVKLAENDEEKVILKKKLSVATRQLAALEKPGPLREGEIGKIVEGVESEAVKVVDGVTVVEGVMEDDLGPDEHCIVVKAPVHVCKEEIEVRRHLLYLSRDTLGRKRFTVFVNMSLTINHLHPVMVCGVPQSHRHFVYTNYFQSPPFCLLLILLTILLFD